MEYEPDVGEDDDCFFSPGTKTAAALANIFPINPTSQQVTNENATAVVIENAKVARTMPQVHPKLTDYDNDNTNTDNQTGSSGVLIASGSTLLLTRCTRTSDNNHRLKSPHYPQQNPPPPNHHHQSSSPSISSPENIIMEESTTIRSIVCNTSNFQRETSPRGNFGMSSRTMTRKTGGTWSSWLPHYHQPNLASVFVLILVVISLSVNTCLASNYSGSSGHNNYTSSRSNYLAETRNNNNNQQQQTSDKLEKENVFKDLTTVEDINGLLQLEESELDGSRQDYKEDNGLGEGDQEHYTHQWAVHILGGPEVAARVAEKHGFHFHGEILQDYYHLTHSRVAKRSIEPHTHYHTRLANEPEVRWLKQQTVKRRVKRDFLPEASGLSQPQTAAVSAVRPGISIGQKSGRSRAARRSKSIVLNDPRWPAMWYLNRGGGLDMNVLEAWNEGITGKGIVVTILDDGLEKDHPDIVRNYDPMASFDVNSLDTDPMPTYDLTDSNRHGTRCAGEVAAEANNSICAVGIAYEAGVGGVRMLDGDVTDAVEARSLSHNPQHIDIYSASWGPDDDGKTVDGPGELATRAFMEGVTKGRNGKGSIFVWASGNGGRDHDNCNCDGYTNSIWTLSISSATENGLVPWYSEACSSTLATTYSSGGTGEKQIVTIDLHHSCTSSHTGTSASAPLAAGICALALHANNNLTWRDMQHIVVRTARPQHLIANDWATNGVGRNVSHSFGYGLMDAGAMVKLAKKWKTVPQQHKCEIKAPYTDKNIPSKSKVTLDLKVTNCPNVNYLEHVQAKVTLTSGRRGDLQIFLISPAGTKSQLLAHRRHDLNRAGFTDWPFMTVHSWGESPVGKWTLEIHNEGRYAGKLQTWSLIAHGITSNPNDQAGGSATGEGESTGSTGVGEKTMPPGSSAVVDATNTNNFDGSDNTLDSTLQANGDALPSHAGIAKPVSIVGRPSAPAQQEASSSSADCVKLSAQGQCLECVPGLALLHSDCVSRCPDTFYVESQGTSSLQSQEDSSPSSYNLHYFCRPCHYSCQTCSGPGDDECISCYSDAKLHRISTSDPGSQVTDKAHCYPLDLMNTLDQSDLSHRILLAVVGLAIVFILIMLSLLCCSRASSSQNKKGDNPFKKHWEQPYKRINPEEEDDGEYEDEEDDEYQYYPASSNSGASTSSGRGGLKRHSNQTHLELISEDEEEDFEHVTSVGGGTSIRTGQEIEAPPKVPLLLHSYSRQQDTNESSNSAAEKGPLV